MNELRVIRRNNTIVRVETDFEGRTIELSRMLPILDFEVSKLTWFSNDFDEVTMRFACRVVVTDEEGPGDPGPATPSPTS